jgi:hypothetical protein
LGYLFVVYQYGKVEVGYLPWRLEDLRNLAAAALEAVSECIGGT